MSDKNQEDSPPDQWAAPHFHWFLGQTERLGQVLDLSTSGIQMLRAVPRVVEVLAKYDGDESDAVEQRLQHARDAAQLAQREVDTGFPVLFGQGAVTLWSYLEGMVRGLVCDWLRNEGDALDVPEVAKLKVPVGKYRALEKDGQIDLIFELLEASVAAGLRNGVKRFEALLAPFSLAGPFPRQWSRDIYELGQVRNALLHRGGTADRTLIEACPWLDLKVGDSITVTQADFRRYFRAVHEYMLALLIRVSEKHGVDQSDSAEEQWQRAEARSRRPEHPTALEKIDRGTSGNA